jgi:hypothetical protein
MRRPKDGTVRYWYRVEDFGIVEHRATYHRHTPAEDYFDNGRGIDIVDQWMFAERYAGEHWRDTGRTAGPELPAPWPSEFPTHARALVAAERLWTRRIQSLKDEIERYKGQVEALHDDAVR